MKLIKTIFLFIITIICLGCDSDDENEANLFVGATFFRTSYVLETPFDGNNDGVFSYDAIEELGEVEVNSCRANSFLHFMKIKL